MLRGKGKELLAGGAGARQVAVHIGNLTINVDGSGSPEETAQTIADKLRRLPMSQTGDTLQMPFN